MMATQKTCVKTCWQVLYDLHSVKCNEKRGHTWWPIVTAKSKARQGVIADVAPQHTGGGSLCTVPAQRADYFTGKRSHVPCMKRAEPQQSPGCGSDPHKFAMHTHLPKRFAWLFALCLCFVDMWTFLIFCNAILPDSTLAWPSC